MVVLGWESSTHFLSSEVLRKSRRSLCSHTMCPGCHHVIELLQIHKFSLILGAIWISSEQQYDIALQVGECNPTGPNCTQWTHDEQTGEIEEVPEFVQESKWWFVHLCVCVCVCVCPKVHIYLCSPHTACLWCRHIHTCYTLHICILHNHIIM